MSALRDWTQTQFEQLAPLMQARQQAGWVRECHGDLHLANMVLIDGRVQLFDCIEFNEDLRWMDVASEIAFVYIDLLAHQQPGLADWLLDEVLSRSGDYEAARVLRFYAVYRAMVRAKVAALRSVQTQGDASEVEAYVALAERLLAPPPLRLVITHGLSGCGKTVASDALAASRPACLDPAPALGRAAQAPVRAGAQLPPVARGWALAFMPLMPMSALTPTCASRLPCCCRPAGRWWWMRPS